MTDSKLSEFSTGIKAKKNTAIVFTINPNQNTISPVRQCTFSELGFREREHLQEWIAKNPEALGEDLLIIQKEFDGFNDTAERLDLLALDKQGNLVIIENKLDDSGRDVTWQALKYASYCASLTKAQIIQIFQAYLDKQHNDQSAEDELSAFYEDADIEEIALNKGQTQRIMLIAAHFRKEVTNTVLWLLNYKLRVQCFTVTPYSLGEQLLLDVKQIIPMPDTEEYTISMATKTQDDIASQEHQKEKHAFRHKFWTQLLSVMNGRSDLFQNISPSNYHWIGTGTGVRGVGLNFAILNNNGRAEVYIDRRNKAENKFIFDYFLEQKATIEERYGGELDWQRLDNKQASRISTWNTSNGLNQPEQWDNTIDQMVGDMIRLEKAFRASIQKLNQVLKTNPH